MGSDRLITTQYFREINAKEHKIKSNSNGTN